MIPRSTLLGARQEPHPAEGDKQRLASLKDKFRGKRIFIIGNGPSLNKTPLQLLKYEYTFGVNRIHLLYDRIDWKPTFYTANDLRVVPDIAGEINGLTGSTFFFEEVFRDILREGPDVYYYTHKRDHHPDHPEEKLFGFEITRGLRGAGSVVGTAIQLAYYMGFDPIYLIGCDLGYKVLETVQQEGEDKFGTGVKLHLTSTQDDDPNHFDPRYFGKGRQWHDPNVKRMIQGHRICRAAIERQGRSIFNATIGGSLEVYERRDFQSLFTAESMPTSVLWQHATLGETRVVSGAKVRPAKAIEDQPPRFVSALNEAAGSQAPPFVSVPCSRDEKAQLDESRLVFEMLKSTVKSGVMVDVGAHYGTTLRQFAAAGWTVYAFEPDPTNREKLTSRLGAKPNVLISDEAVSDRSGQVMPFYASDESSGISALCPFRDGHREVAKVRTVTLNDVVARHGLAKIDFLKIDVEGFEMAVLRGLDFARLKPSVIVAEFEDSKTRNLGYTSLDLARLLEDEGYTVYVSEWHPVERYGVKHSWRYIRRYPCDIASDAWGNFIAFQESPSAGDLIKAVRAAADRLVQFLDYPDTANSAMRGKPQGRSDQMLHRVLRLLRRPVPMGALALVGALLAAAAATRALPGSWLGDLESDVLFSVIAANLLFTAIATGSAYAYLRSRLRSLRQAVHSRIDDVASIETAHNAAHNTAIERLDAAIERLAQQVSAMEAKHNTAIERLDAAIERLAQQVSAMEAKHNTALERLDAAIERLAQQLSAMGAKHNTALERLAQQASATEAKIPETREQLATLIDALDKRVTRQSQIFSRLNAANAARARSHVRLLNDTALARLEKHWAPLFGQQLQPTAFAYLAHQICVAEDRCDGRLATTIEAAMLRQLALRSLKGPELDLIEIGTLFGIGAGVLHRFRGDGITRLRLTLVDPLSGYYAPGKPDPATGMTIGAERLKRNLRILDVPEEDIILLQGLSTDTDIVEAARRRSYDFALIDGDHSGAGVRRDFELYGPMIRPGGLLLFDDYDTKDWPEIKPAVDDLMKAAEGWEWVGADWRTGIARRLPAGAC